MFRRFFEIVLTSLLLLSAQAYAQPTDIQEGTDYNIDASKGVSICAGTGDVRVATDCSGGGTQTTWKFNNSTGLFEGPIGATSINLPNDTYLTANNAAGTGTINICKVDTGDNTVCNSSASDEFVIQLEDDAQRLIRFTAQSDAAITMTWGDGGTTAVQLFSIMPATADADDDSTLQLGNSSGTRGAGITLPGEEVAGGADITYNAGAGDTHLFKVNGTTEFTMSDDDFKWSATTALFHPDTADAADNAKTSFAGGGTASATQGAYINLYGNEHASTGSLEAFAGNTATGAVNLGTVGDAAISFYQNNAIAWSVDTSSNFAQNATNGGNISVSKADTSILLGTTSFDSDITDATGVQPWLLIQNSASGQDHAAFVANNNNAGGVMFDYFKTRGTGGDANTIALAGDNIVSWTGYLADGAAYKNAARITFGIDTTPGTNDAPGNIKFFTTPDGSTTLTQAFSIDSAQNLFSSGELSFTASGDTIALQEATAGAKCMGSLTCNGASDVVTSTTCATTSSRIFLTRTSLDTDTTGDYYVKSISNGTSFTVACETSDTATLNWIIFHEAA